MQKGAVLVLIWLALLCSAASATEIVEVRWEPDLAAIHIFLDAWPGHWDGWRFFLNGEEIPMEGGPGEPVIRPDAALSAPPSGLLVGTLPWLSGLSGVDFPCCGTIRLYIPGEGLTNEFHYNLADLGCRTASQADCPREWEVHTGEFVIPPGEERTITGKFWQQGHVRIQAGGTLTLEDAEFVMTRGDVPTVHVYFFVEPGGKLVIRNSTIRHLPRDPGASLICVVNRGQVEMVDSQTEIHLLDMAEGASFTMIRSTMVNPIGGLLQLGGGEARLVDSTIGALGLTVPAGGRLVAEGLHSGMYFEHWDVHELIPAADYNLVLERTRLLKDDLSGELRHGPYERGWIFFLDPGSQVRLSNCELRKVFLDVRNTTAEFHGLKVGVPVSLHWRDIVLEDVVVQGQWPFTIENARVTIYDSNYLFLQPSGFSTVRLVRSHMVEFIPRGFFGEMIFQDAAWTEAGEIIGGVHYHSEANDFIMRGSLAISGLRENLQWKDARVRREFELIVRTEAGAPIPGSEVVVGGRRYRTDAEGRAAFWLTFTEENYNRPVRVKVRLGGELVAAVEVDFFTSSPIVVKLVR